MDCFHCKGKMIKGSAPFSVDRNGYHISWESIPAWVCTQCGEAFFEENEVNHIQKALDKIDLETIALRSNTAQKTVPGLYFFSAHFCSNIPTKKTAISPAAAHDVQVDQAEAYIAVEHQVFRPSQNMPCQADGGGKHDQRGYCNTRLCHAETGLEECMV